MFRRKYSNDYNPGYLQVIENEDEDQYRGRKVQARLSYLEDRPSSRVEAEEVPSDYSGEHDSDASEEWKYSIMNEVLG